jgi:hypothetical protein
MVAEMVIQRKGTLDPRNEIIFKVGNLRYSLRHFLRLSPTMNQNKEKQNKIIHTATTYQNAKREIYWILYLAIQAFARYVVCEYSTVYNVKIIL